MMEELDIVYAKRKTSYPSMRFAEVEERLDLLFLEARENGGSSEISLYKSRSSHEEDQRVLDNQIADLLRQISNRVVACTLDN